jgi:hypothetical protein
MGSKTDYHENKVLELLRGNTYTAPATVYSALYTTAPTDSSAGTECTATTSGYTRLATTFSTATGGSVQNSGSLIWATLAAAFTVIGWALADAITVSGAGNLLYYTTVTTVAFVTGDQPTIAIGGIVITED